MRIEDILASCDHTLLAQTATRSQIRALCDDGMKYHTASVCIPPCFVKMAKDYVGDRLKICTVIGFPNGYQTTAVKCFETSEAVRSGADEIDMVINIGDLKDGRDEDVYREICAVKQACDGRLLKVIIEACMLTEEEKIRMCRIVTRAGAEYIKTSTGFSKGGATREDVALMRKHVGSEIRVKAAGGISSIADAEDFLALGADRLGTSRVVLAVKQMEEKQA